MAMMDFRSSASVLRFFGAAAAAAACNLANRLFTDTLQLLLCKHLWMRRLNDVDVPEAASTLEDATATIDL